MVGGQEYINIVKDYYSFLVAEFNLRLVNLITRGNAFYDVQYGDNIKVISINYENIEDYFQVIIYQLENGKLPDYDDKTKTRHLNSLNSLVYAKTDSTQIESNNKFFNIFHPKDELERKLLKSAKDLRLYLLFLNKL